MSCPPPYRPPQHSYPPTPKPPLARPSREQTPGPCVPAGVERLPAEEAHSAGPEDGDGIHWHGESLPGQRMGLSPHLCPSVPPPQRAASHSCSLSTPPTAGRGAGRCGGGGRGTLQALVEKDGEGPESHCLARSPLPALSPTAFRRASNMGAGWGIGARSVLHLKSKPLAGGEAARLAQTAEGGGRKARGELLQPLEEPQGACMGMGYPHRIRAFGGA